MLSVAGAGHQCMPARGISRQICSASLTFRRTQCQHSTTFRNTGALRQRRAFKCQRPSQGLHLRAMMDEGELVPDVDEGTRVKVTGEVTVFHAPKIKELQLKGMEGSVKTIVKKYKGRETSANLPYRIEFLLEKDDGKQQKFFCHLAASEFEKID